MSARDRNQAGYGRAANSTKARIAELMALDVSQQAIADRLGIQRKSVTARMSEIRRELGWQAQ